MTITIEGRSLTVASFDLEVTGSLTPNATGFFFDNGSTWEGMPVLERSDGLVWIFAYGVANWHVIAFTPPGVETSTFWLGFEDIGTYMAIGVDGEATVASAVLSPDPTGVMSANANTAAGHGYALGAGIWPRIYWWAAFALWMLEFDSADRWSHPGAAIDDEPFTPYSGAAAGAGYIDPDGYGTVMNPTNMAGDYEYQGEINSQPYWKHPTEEYYFSCIDLGAVYWGITVVPGVLSSSYSLSFTAGRLPEDIDGGSGFPLFLFGVFDSWWWVVNRDEFCNIHWENTTSDDASEFTQWSMLHGGTASTSGVIPSVDFRAIFETRDGDCNWDIATVGEIETEVTYDGVITQSVSVAIGGALNQAGGDYDAAASNLSCDDFTAAGNLFDAGSGSHTVSGNFDNAAVTAWAGTATWLATGVAKDLNLKYTGVLGSLTVTGTYTIHSGTPVSWHYAYISTLIVSGTGELDITDFVGNGLRVLVDCQVPDITAKITGTGMLRLQNSGTTLSNKTGVIDCAKLECLGPVLDSGTYESATVNFRGYGTADVVFGAGTTTFKGAVTFDSRTGGDVANNINNPDLIFEGDVTHEAGFDWISGDGSVAFAGGNPQNVDMDAAGIIEDVTINKTAGTVTLVSDLECPSFTPIAGTLDMNGQKVVTDALVLTSVGFVFADLAGSAFEATSIVCDGQTLDATSEWTLDVAGEPTATNTAFQNCNASGGETIKAYGPPRTCTDLGDNQNILFWLGPQHIASVGYNTSEGISSHADQVVQSASVARAKTSETFLNRQSYSVAHGVTQ
jgi:hypothetical protein